MPGPKSQSASPFKQGWLIGPWTDFSFFIATPLFIVPFFNGLLNFFSLTALKLGILGVSATGHHLPGLIRAYTDSSIFNRFRLRLVLVPALFILLTAATAWFKLSLAFLLLIVWSTWHGSMQILGFLRIYDLKSGFQSVWTARLDYWMCLTWFVQVVLWSVPKKMSVLSSFYLAGGPLLPARAAPFFELGWLLLTFLVTAAYLARVILDWKRARYFNLVKLLCMASSIWFWGYCMVSVGNLIVGLILWEIFHDLQYNVFVWKYNHTRVARNLSQSGIEKFLFRSDWKKIGFYALCIAAYGSIGLLAQDVFNVYQNQPAYANLMVQIGNIFAASGLIHFYLDGFIWKVRDGKVQQDLGMQAAGGFRERPKALHGIGLALFFTACAGLGVSEYHHLNVSPTRPQADNLVDLVPRSGYANFMKASRLRAAGASDSAVVYYERAIRYDSNFNFSHGFIAELKYEAGDMEGAQSHYEKALVLDPESVLMRENLADLYLRTGDYPKAKELFLGLWAQDSLNAEYAYQIAWSLLQMKRGLEAKPHLEKSLRLNPRQPAALNYLGMVEQALGNREQARALYRKSLELDSTYVHARENLMAIGP